MGSRRVYIILEQCVEYSEIDDDGLAGFSLSALWTIGGAKGVRRGVGGGGGKVSNGCELSCLEE